MLQLYYKNITFYYILQLLLIVLHTQFIMYIVAVDNSVDQEYAKSNKYEKNLGGNLMRNKRLKENSRHYFNCLNYHDNCHANLSGSNS